MESIYCLEVATSILKHKHIEIRIYFAKGITLAITVEILEVQTGLVGRHEVVPNVDVETDKAAGQ